MKKITLGLLTLGLLASASAQTYHKSLNDAKAAFKKQQRMRVPTPKEGITARTLPQGAKMTPANSTASSLPADRWFPGEWEEVQAIVVTWPYMSLPANWQSLGDQLQYYGAQPVFSGYGDIYKYVYHQTYGWYPQNQGFGPIDQIPYCIGLTMDTSADYASDREFTSVFAYLIDGIRQGGAQPWVRITHLSDSTYIKRHMQWLGLATNDIKWIEGFGDAFWFRDCGPICFYYGDQDSVGMLDFQYYPGRVIDDSLPYLIEAQMGIPNWTTSIEWEGGNCIVDGDGFVLTSDHIYPANADRNGQLLWAGPSTSPSNYETKPALTAAQVRDSLAYLMGPRGVKVLPAFEYDGGTGHVDLYADMLDENQFVFSKFPSRYSNWTDYRTAAKNIDSICSWQNTFGNNYKHSYIPFPRKDDGSFFSSQTEYWNENQGTGYTRTYSNHTFVNNVIIQPCFSPVVNGTPSAQWDREYLDSLRAAYPGYTFYPIDIRSFDGYGGAIHCITKQIPAENPIRILHPSITGRTGNTYRNTDATIEARISNRSGIASATVHYRANGGQWQTLPMNASGNTWTATLPTSNMQGDTVSVEYYISASSNNGKTISKPFTGANGGAYTFTMDNNVAIVEANDNNEAFGQFYPNPASDQAHLEINLKKGAHYNVTIMDISGRTVHTSTLAAQGQIVYTINASRLQNGIYNVLFSNGNEQIVRRLIVK